jgi:hypothetical protein
MLTSPINPTERVIGMLKVDEMRKADLEYLESKDIVEVLKEIALDKHGRPGSQDRSEIGAWILSKQIELYRDSEVKRDAREEETLRIAKSANRIAWIAIMIASILSTLSIISTIIIKTP